MHGMVAISEDEESDGTNVSFIKSMPQNQGQTNQTILTSSPSPYSKPFINIKTGETKDEKSFSGVVISPKPTRHKSVEPSAQHKKTYNPKTSEQIKFFLAHNEQ